MNSDSNAKSVSETLNDIYEKYSGNPELQALVGVAGVAIPALAAGVLVSGGTLAFGALPILSQWVVGHGSARLMNRLEMLVQAMKAELECMRDSKIDKGFFKTDLGADLMLKAIQGAMHTRSKTKIDEYAKVLVAAAVRPSKALVLEDYMNALSELEEKELLFAKRMFEFQKDEQLSSYANSGTWRERIRWEKMTNGYSFSELQFLFTRISRTGLIAAPSGMAWGSPGDHQDYEISEVFREIMSVLNEASAKEI